MMVSEAQKRARKKYDSKCNTLAIKYYEKEFPEYAALKAYLKKENISFNSYCKKLILSDLKNKGLIEK